ncbi:MAG: LacI family DNA-binding transcriptional regulator [Anaerolineales bacterium]|jgi:LacI family transcriptional regulator
MERRRRASLKDVAARAHTSIATASRALSGTGYVAKTTRARILKAAKALSYQPNLRARGLRQRFSRSIGLIIPNLLNAYYTALADAISQQLVSHGYHLLLSSTRDEPQTEHDTVTDMVGQAVDGLIWVPASSDSGLLDYLASQHTPVVIIVRRLPNDPVDTVVFEDRAGSKAATQHLLSLGHERIGYIGGDVMFSSNQCRWQGHLEALHEAGVPVDEALIKLGTNRSTWGAMATNDLLRLPSPPTAIFVASNAIMPGVIRTLRQLDVRLPEDLSLICFDDVEWFSFSVPPITAVSTASTALAESAVDLLLTRIEHGDASERPPVFLEVNFELIVRRSVVSPRSTPLYVREGHLEDAQT